MTETHYGIGPYELYVPVKGGRKAILFDVDGTLALPNGRGLYDDTQLINDLPNMPIIRLVREFFNCGYALVGMTGRPEKCRTDTELWLRQWLGPYEELFMRADHDHRHDTEIKRDLFNEHVRPYYKIDYVLDDRDHVVKMWRSLGLVCLAVATNDS